MLQQKPAYTSNGTMSQPLSESCKLRRWPITDNFVRVLMLALTATCSISISRVDAQDARAVEFTNVTAASGIKFKHFKGNNGISINREEFGPGVCVADFDGDGWQDIYFVTS